MWTWSPLWRPSLSWSLSDQDLQVRRAHFLSGDSRPTQPDLQTLGATLLEAHMFWIWGILLYRAVCVTWGQQRSTKWGKRYESGTTVVRVFVKILTLIRCGLSWLLGYRGQEQEWDLKALKRQRLQHFTTTQSAGCLQLRRSWMGSKAVKDFRDVLRCWSFIGCQNTSALFSK